MYTERQTFLKSLSDLLVGALYFILNCDILAIQNKNVCKWDEIVILKSTKI